MKCLLKMADIYLKLEDIKESDEILTQIESLAIKLSGNDSSERVGSTLVSICYILFKNKQNKYEIYLSKAIGILFK